MSDDDCEEQVLKLTASLLWRHLSLPPQVAASCTQKDTYQDSDTLDNARFI